MSEISYFTRYPRNTREIVVSENPNFVTCFVEGKQTIPDVRHVIYIKEVL